MDAERNFRYLYFILVAAVLGLFVLFSNQQAHALSEEASSTRQSSVTTKTIDTSTTKVHGVQHHPGRISPTGVYLLLVFGIYFLFLEFLSPGIILPGMIGVLLLIIAFYFMQHLVISYSGLLLLFIGLALMFAEGLWLSYGALGLSGTITFVLGSLLLFPLNPLSGELSLWIIGAMTLFNLTLLFVLIRMAIKSRQLQLRHGLHLLLGMEGRALGPIHEQGQAIIRGEIWNVRSSAPIAADTIIKVLDFDGLTLTVAAKI